jgi:two-component system, OmpR family, sensor histidine kinase MtrB
MSATSLQRAAAAWWRPLRGLPGRWWAVVALWRRSIQARVVIGTLVLSAVVVVLVGWVLLQQISTGLVEGKRVAALSDATAGFESAQQQLDAAATTGQADPGQLLTQLVDNLASQGGQSGLYEVVLSGPIAEPQPVAQQATVVESRGSRSSPGIQPRSIPLALRLRVESRPGSWWAYTQIHYPDEAQHTSVPGLAIGSQLRLSGGGGTYALYYLFPLTEQQATLRLVERALFTAGALLIVLLGAVAFLVTRQVVTPVRLARRIAERLAAGRLDERMHVRGEDDIARLGTSFNQMATSLQRQIRQLEALSQGQRRFVSDVSHELRTPLTTVRMAADVLHDARDRFDPVTARSAELLQAELNRFESLLSDLLEISRFDAGAAVLQLEDVDLVEVARRTVEWATALAKRHGCELRILAPHHPCMAEADVRRVERIVRNLVVNAIEHGEGSDVVIRVAASADAAALSVQDHGVGFTAAESALVFNRFWRADPARTRTTGGTGLGLAISLEDALLHGGWLQAAGKPGAGAVFRLTLPKRAGDPLERSPLPLLPPAPLPAAGAAPSLAGRDAGIRP